jgi:hypothetical protein
MPDYSVERQGPGRRAVDYESHCDMHQHNSTLIEQHSGLLVELRTGVSTVKWILGITVPVVLALFGLAYQQSSDNQKAMQSDLKEIKSVTATVPTEIRYIRADIEEIRGHVK